MFSVRRFVEPRNRTALPLGTRADIRWRVRHRRRFRNAERNTDRRWRHQRIVPALRSDYRAIRGSRVVASCDSLCNAPLSVQIDSGAITLYRSRVIASGHASDGDRNTRESTEGNGTATRARCEAGPGIIGKKASEPQVDASPAMLMPRRVASVTTGARIESLCGIGFQPVRSAQAEAYATMIFRTAEAMPATGTANFGWYHEARDHRAARPNRDEGVFVCPPGGADDGE